MARRTLKLPTPRPLPPRDLTCDVHRRAGQKRPALFAAREGAYVINLCITCNLTARRKYRAQTFPLYVICAK